MQRQNIRQTSGNLVEEEGRGLWEREGPSTPQDNRVNWPGPIGAHWDWTAYQRTCMGLTWTLCCICVVWSSPWQRNQGLSVTLLPALGTLFPVELTSPYLIGEEMLSLAVTCYGWLIHMGGLHFFEGKKEEVDLGEKGSRWGGIGRRGGRRNCDWAGKN